MNNSDTPAPIEEKWMAYFDGKMSPAEAAAFEREHPGAADERESFAAIAGSIRAHSVAPPMRNVDLFNAQILEQIAPPKSVAAAPRRALWPLWRLAFAGACSAMVGAGIYAFFVRGNEDGMDRYRAQVVSTHTEEPGVSATVLDADGLAVVWIDGLDQLPKDYVLR